jgi:hypothetical protein
MKNKVESLWESALFRDHGFENHDEDSVVWTSA